MRTSSSTKIITVSGSYSLKKPKSPRDRPNCFLLSILAVIVYEKNRWVDAQWAETRKGGLQHPAHLGLRWSLPNYRHWEARAFYTNIN